MVTQYVSFNDLKFTLPPLLFIGMAAGGVQGACRRTRPSTPNPRERKGVKLTTKPERHVTLPFGRPKRDKGTQMGVRPAPDALIRDGRSHARVRWFQRVIRVITVACQTHTLLHAPQCCELTEMHGWVCSRR